MASQHHLQTLGSHSSTRQTRWGPSSRLGSDRWWRTQRSTGPLHTRPFARLIPTSPQGTALRWTATSLPSQAVGAARMVDRHAHFAGGEARWGHGCHDVSASYTGMHAHRQRCLFIGLGCRRGGRPERRASSVPRRALVDRPHAVSLGRDASLLLGPCEGDNPLEPAHRGRGGVQGRAGGSGRQPRPRHGCPTAGPARGSPTYHSPRIRLGRCVRGPGVACGAPDLLPLLTPRPRSPGTTFFPHTLWTRSTDCWRLHFAGDTSRRASQCATVRTRASWLMQCAQARPAR